MLYRGEYNFGLRDSHYVLYFNSNKTLIECRESFVNILIKRIQKDIDDNVSGFDINELSKKIELLKTYKEVFIKDGNTSFEYCHLSLNDITVVEL